MSTLKGLIDWNAQRDKDGHREYKARWLIETDDPNDGPGAAFAAPGLPAIGAWWDIGNELDVWAFCWPTATATPVITREPNTLWVVENLFSTKPLDRCQDSSIENPLNEPDRLSGSFVKYMQEAVKDKDDKPIKSSSHERFRGPIVEFDFNRPTVTVGKNLATLPLSSFSSMVDRVNDAAMWGLPKRCVKLSNVSWTRRLYGTCNYYYVVNYEFDINFDTFDRKVYDEGTMVLSEGGDASKPEDFVKYKDINGENTRVFLDGSGKAITDADAPIEVDIQYYKEANFFQLGIPAFF